MEFETRTNAEGVMVTVVCITYNHELYIRDALDSFVRQKTNFKFKVFVGEDCGPDNTAEIVKEYAEKYPDIIVPFLREKNMGAQRNLIDMCQRAESPYIAFCEGDDYWIDDYKLQKQFDYMEANPDLRFCFSRTKIEAPENWHLRNYYKANSNGELIWPDCQPGYTLPNRNMIAEDFISFFPPHTSSVFYRWNYALDIPEWFYNGIIGDIPICTMQLGKGSAGYIPDITSVYRRSNVGVVMNNSTDEHFINTRLDYVRYLLGLREHFEEHYGEYCKVQFENRIKLEVANYLETAIKIDDTEAFLRCFNEYPEASKIALNAYLSFYRDSRSMTNTFTWEGYKLLVRNRYYRNALRPYVKTIKQIEKHKKTLKRIKNKFKNFVSLICYWRYTFTPKQENLWVFSGFMKKGYLDNSKYMYEYVVKNHPEIVAYWLTSDDKVYKMLKEKNMPVCKFNTKECRDILSHANVAFSDHFFMSDYNNFSGFNNRIKKVQLWHGVGLKNLGEHNEIFNTNVPGVQLSYDILSTPGDSFFTKLKKKIGYFRHAYFRELSEEYFLLLCPGEDHINYLAKSYHVPKEKCFKTGHPRNEKLYSAIKEKNKILYAPTYRWNIDAEKQLVSQLLEKSFEIQEKLESLDATLTIRLHPHTWRNYQTKIKNAIKENSRIFLDEEKDIYQTLGEYSVLISDYSSIAFDFIMLDKPVVFFCYDLEEFLASEVKLNHDYEEYSPGAKCTTWEEVMEAIEIYLKNPKQDSEWRQRIGKEFFDFSVNDVDNSERIVREIKRRISLT